MTQGRPKGWGLTPGHQKIMGKKTSQIESAIIRLGRNNPPERTFSMRNIRLEAGVHGKTVRARIRDLKMRGWLISQPGKSRDTYIIDLQKIKSDLKYSARELYETRMRELMASDFELKSFRPIAKARAIRDREDGILELAQQLKDETKNPGNKQKIFLQLKAEIDLIYGEVFSLD